MSAEDGINISMTLDTEGLRQDVRQATDMLRGVGDNTRREAEQTSKAIASMGAALGGLFSLQAAKGFASKVLSIRGDIQQLNIAFETLTGSAERADALMEQLIDTAAKTPFDLMGISEGAKQLMAYGVQAEEVNETLKMLGDIAAGLSLPLNDLVYLYGTTITQGRMYTMDLRQFMGRGIPLAQELARQFGVATSEVNDLVSAGKVGAEEFKQAIASVRETKFPNLMEKQSASITGQIANIQDAIDMMFNDIGSKTEGVINTSLEAVGWAVEHYEALGKAIATLITTYGTYRVAVAVTTMTHVKLLRSLVQLRQAFRALRLSMATNPYALLASAVVGVVTAVALFSDRTSSAEKAQKRLNKALEEEQEILDTKRRKTDELLETVRSETETQYRRNEALRELQMMYPAIFSDLDLEAVKTRQLVGLKRDLAKAQDESSLALKRSRVRELEDEVERQRKQISEQARGPVTSGNFGATVNISGALARAQEDLRNARKDLADTEARMREASLTIDDKIARASANLALLEGRKSLLEGRGISPDDLADIDELDRRIMTARDELAQLKRQASVPKAKSELAETTRQIKDLEARIAGLRAGTIAPEGGQTLVDELKTANDELTRLRANYKLLTGEGAGANKSARKGAKALIKARREQAEREAQAEYQLRQMQIEAMEDGVDKQLRANALAHDRLLHQIEQQRQEWAEAQAKLTGASAASPDLLTTAQKAHLGLLTEAADKAFARANASALKDALDGVRTYEQERTRITEEYQRRREALYTKEGALVEGATQGNLEEIARQESDALRQVDDHFAEREETYKTLLRRLSKMSLEALRQALAEAEKVLASAQERGVGGSKLAEARASVRAVQEQIKEQERLVVDDATPAEMTVKGWQDLYETLGRVKQSFAEIGDSLGGISGKAIKVAGDITTSALQMINGITTLANWSIKSQEMVAKGASAAVKSVEKASVILAIVGAALQVISKVKSVITSLFNADNEADARAEAFAATVRSLNADLAVTKDRAEMAHQALQIFAGDGYNAAQRNVSLAEKALKRYNTAMEEAIKTDQNASIFGGLISLKTDLSGLETAAQKYGRIIGQMAVQTREATGLDLGLFRIGGHDAEYKTIKDLLPELFNADESINFDALDKVFGSDVYAKFSDGVKASLSEVKKAHDEYIESTKALDSYLKGVFGELGNDLMSGIVEAFRNGEDASEHFAQSVSKTLEKLISDMVFSSVFSDTFKAAEDRMRDLTSRGASQEEYIQFYAKLMDQVTALKDEADRQLKTAQEVGRRNGLDLFAATKDKTEDRREASRRGIAQASQDTVDELNGRATAIQSHTYIISENSNLLVRNTNEMLLQVSGIRSNTDELRRLKSVEDTLKGVRFTLGEIQQKGLKMN